MDPGLFLRGLAIGFAVAAALGPVGLLVIRRTLERGWLHGMVSGLGVATADAVYGAIAAFGLTAVTQLLVGIDRPLGLVGGAILLVLAGRMMLAAREAPPAAREPAARAQAMATAGTPGLAVAWLTIVGLTLTNPATILSFAALFASIGAGTGGPAGAALVTGGVFAGSVVWWAALTGVTAALRTRLTPRAVRLLNVAAALILAAFGIAAIAIGLVAG